MFFSQDLAARLEALEKQAKDREAELQAKNRVTKAFQVDVKNLTDKLNKARNDTAALNTSTAPMDQQLQDVQVPTQRSCNALFLALSMSFIRPLQ